MATEELSRCFRLFSKSMLLNQEPKIKFSGSGSFLKFREEFEEWLQIIEVQDNDKVILLTRALEGRARRWYDLIGRKVVADVDPRQKYTKLVEALENVFEIAREKKAVWEAEFFSEFMRKGDDLLRFVEKKIELGRKLKLEDATILEVIKARLVPSDREFFEGRFVATLEELFRLATIRTERWQQYTRQRNDGYYRRIESKTNEKPKSPEANMPPRLEGHYKQPARPARKAAYERPAPRQSNHGRPNFVKANLNVLKVEERKDNCKNKLEKHVEIAQLNTIKLTNVTLPNISVVFNEIPIEALIDTGAQKSFLSENFKYKYCKNLKLYNDVNVSVTSAEGNECKVIGYVVGMIKIRKEKMKLKLYVIKNLQQPLILGIDFLEEAKSVLNFAEATAEFSLDEEVKNSNVSLPEIDWSDSLVPDTEKDRVKQLIGNFSNLFDEKPGLTHVISHSIDTGNAKPVFTRPYKYDRTKEEIIAKHVEEMLKNKIISPTQSEYSSPVVLVRKKNDYDITDHRAYRFCVDFRKLNANTNYPKYPLPVIEDTIRNIKTTQYLSTIDLSSGYFQIPIKEEDRKKTAFTTKSGTFSFNRMPFGVNGAPATFQQLMDKVLKPVIGKCVWVYLDDILVYSETFEEHLRHLRKVFVLLQDAGLTINIKKCKFIRQELRYLGFIISREGIKADESKIVAVKNFKTPRTAKQLASFLGLVSYYRTFIKNFAEIAEPLYKLRRKLIKFKWTDEAQKAFEQLKETLIKAPVLRHPDPNKQFEIFTDASSCGVGAVLSQEGRPIAYISRTLSSAERNYTTTEREILAIVVALDKFKIYLNNLPVKIITDHSALTRLYTGKNLSPRVIRWALKLQEFNMVIEHRAGSENKVADALSRNPIKEDGNIACTLLNSVVLDSPQTVIDELQNDEEFGELYRFMLNPDEYEGPNAEILRNRSANYEIIDGLLFYKKKVNQFGEYTPVIPMSLRMETLRLLHDIPSSGHCGIRKTFEKAKECVFWPKMRQWINEYVRSCDTCQRYNYVNFKPAGYLKSVKCSFPNEIVGVDLIGPYPRSQIGKYRFVLVIVDHFSKWIELIPLKRASAKAVRDSFLNKYILHYGIPIQIISDNGKQFSSSLFEEMCHKFDIKHTKLVPYRPQGNIVERYNRSVIKMISSYVKEYHSQWDEHLEEFAFALRTVKSDTTKVTPAELFLGRKIVTPLDKIFFVKGREPQFSCKDVEKLVREARIEIEKAQQIQQRYYNAHRRDIDISVGDKVLKCTHPLSSAKDKFVGKFAPKFEGPYLVVGMQNNNFKIEQNNTVVVVNADQVKKYYERENMPLLSGVAVDGSHNKTVPQPSTSANRANTNIPTPGITQQPSTSTRMIPKQTKRKDFSNGKHHPNNNEDRISKRRKNCNYESRKENPSVKRPQNDQMQSKFKKRIRKDDLNEAGPSGRINPPLKRKANHEEQDRKRFSHSRGLKRKASTTADQERKKKPEVDQRIPPKDEGNAKRGTDVQRDPYMLRKRNLSTTYVRWNQPKDDGAAKRGIDVQKNPCMLQRRNLSTAYSRWN